MKYTFCTYNIQLVLTQLFYPVPTVWGNVCAQIQINRSFLNQPIQPRVQIKLESKIRNSCHDHRRPSKLIVLQNFYNTTLSDRTVSLCYCLRLDGSLHEPGWQTTRFRETVCYSVDDNRTVVYKQDCFAKFLP